jgi:hypothetical protein
MFPILISKAYKYRMSPSYKWVAFQNFFHKSFEWNMELNLLQIQYYMARLLASTQKSIYSIIMPKYKKGFEDLMAVKMMTGSTLKLETICSEMLVTTKRAIWHHNPDDHSQQAKI